MTTFEEIMKIIEEDVRCNPIGNLYGHEQVAEYLAERIDALVKENEELKAKLALVGWEADYRRGMNF